MLGQELAAEMNPLSWTALTLANPGFETGDLSGWTVVGPAGELRHQTPPARERLTESRTIKGSGVAGVATVGATRDEVAQEVLTETQEAVLPLVPYLDSLRWVFIAVALAGIAVAIYARIRDWRARRR